MTNKGQARREEIVEQTISVVAESGIADLSFEAISKATGLTKPHIQYYFKSKEVLLLDCFQHIATVAQQITQKHVESKHTWQGRLLAVAEAAFIWIDRHPQHAAVLFLYYHYCTLNPQLSKVHQEVRAVGRERIEEILKAGLPENKKSQIAQLAFNIQTYLTGVVMEMASAQSFHDESFRKQACNHIDHLLEMVA